MFFFVDIVFVIEGECIFVWFEIFFFVVCNVLVVGVVFVGFDVRIYFFESFGFMGEECFFYGMEFGDEFIDSFFVFFGDFFFVCFGVLE